MYCFLMYRNDQNLLQWKNLKIITAGKDYGERFDFNCSNISALRPIKLRETPNLSPG